MRKPRIRRNLVVLSMICWLSLANPPASFGQASKPPKLGYVFPPVVIAGQTNAVTMGGYDFTPDMQSFVHDEKIQLTIDGLPGDYHLPPPPYWTGPRASSNAPPIPREMPVRFTVAEDVPDGFVRWQVANANGASDTAVLLVSSEPEMVESRSRDFAQDLPSLPIGVSGRLSRLTEVDKYRFVADRNGFATVDLMARRLGSDFNGAIKVEDANGQVLADFSDTLGLDGAVTFPVAAGGSYTVSLHDTDFRGDRAYIYRLALKYGSPMLAVSAAYGQRGTSSNVKLFGRGVQTGQNVIESIESMVTIASDGNLHTQQVAGPTGSELVSMTIPLSDHSEIISQEGAESQSVVPPVGVSGFFDENRREHRFQWTSGKDDRWTVAVQSRALGSRMDVLLEILGPDGKRVADSDETQGSTDAALEFQASVEGLYTAVVRGIPVNITGGVAEGNSLDQYRFVIRKAETDFELSTPQAFAIGLGEKAELPVQVVRRGGFAEAVRLTVDDLPEGLSITNDPVIPAGANEVKLSLQCATDCAVVARVIRIAGTAAVNGNDVTRKARAMASGCLCPTNPDSVKIDGTLLAITMKAPFSVKVVDRERQHDVHRGTTFLAELDIVRDAGFSDGLRIEMSAQQDRLRMGVRGGILDVSPSETKVFYPTFMPEWLSTDLTRRILVHGVAVIPDPKGNLRHVSKAGDARITMIMEGALLKVSAKAPENIFQPGDVIQVPVQVSRSPKLPVPSSITLDIPEELQGVIECEPLILDSAKSSGMLVIRTNASVRLAGPWTWTIRARSLQDEKWPVISQTDIVVKFQ